MQLINDPSHFGEIETSAVLKVMLKSWTQSNLHWSILQHRYGDLKRLCCRGNPLLPISGLVGNLDVAVWRPAYGRARHGFPPVPREHIFWRECSVNRRLKINCHTAQVGV